MPILHQFDLIDHQPSPHDHFITLIPFITAKARLKKALESGIYRFVTKNKKSLPEGRLH